MNFRIPFIGLLALLSTPVFAADETPLALSPQRAVEMWTHTITDAQHALKERRVAEAIQLCEAAMTQARNFGPHDTHLAQALVVRAEICVWEKKNVQAEALFKEAITTCEAAVGPNHPALIHPLSSLANYYYYIDPHYERVAALFTRILDIVEHAQPRHDPEVIMWSRNLATIYQQMGDFAHAEPLFNRAVAVAEQSEPQWLSHEQLNEAKFYRAWKKYDRAAEVAQRALAERERALQAAPTDIDRKLDVSVALDELAATYLAAGQLELAETTARRSLAGVASYANATHPELGPRLAALAEVLQARGKLDEAAVTYRQLAALTETNLGGQSAQLADVLAKYAAVLHELKQTDEAAKIDARVAGIRSKLAART